MNSGTLGTTAAEGWSSAYNMNLAGNVTVDTRQYDAGTKSYNDQVIQILHEQVWLLHLYIF